MTSDFVVEKDKFGGSATEIKPKINIKIFLENIGEYSRVFTQQFDFSSDNKMPLHWGSAGFLPNVDLSGNSVNILYGWCLIWPTCTSEEFTAAIEGNSFFNTALFHSAINNRSS